MEKQKQKHIIIAPHADDEIIGCFSVLKGTHTVLFPSESICIEAQKSSEYFGYARDIIDLVTLPHITHEISKKGGFLFVPDPIYEWHPEHRKWGYEGEKLIRAGFNNVVFYSVNMTAPYIREVENTYVHRNVKGKVLDECYPTKKSLWEHDHKYFLFEGFCLWVSNKYLCHD